MRFKTFLENNSMNTLVDSIKQRYPLKYFHAYEKEEPAAIFLDMITVHPESQGQGVGEQVIMELQKYAGSVGKPIVISPSPEKGKKGALERFYKRLGFRHNKGSNKNYELSSAFGPTMIWYPSITSAL